MRLLALLDSASAAASDPVRVWAWTLGLLPGKRWMDWPLFGLVHAPGVLAWHRLCRAFQTVPRADSQDRGVEI